MEFIKWLTRHTYIASLLFLGSGVLFTISSISMVMDNSSKFVVHLIGALISFWVSGYMAAVYMIYKEKNS